MSSASADTDAHRHGGRVHSHPHRGRHRHLTALRLSEPLAAHGHPAHGHSHPGDHGDRHDHAHGHSHPGDHDGHSHSHGLIHEDIKRSREGIRAVSLSLGVLAVAAALQTVVLAASGSIALLADVIHNYGDALTAVPLGIAFALRSRVAERYAGLAVVGAIFVSACVAGVEAVKRIVHPTSPSHLGFLAAAGLMGYFGNFLAARIRLTAGERLDSAALIADGNHAKADAYVSLAVVASAVAVAVGLTVADPLIGLAITFVILRITWESWQTVREDHAH